MSKIVSILLILILASPARANRCTAVLLSQIQSESGWENSSHSVLSQNLQGQFFIDGIEVQEFKVPHSHALGGRHKYMFEVVRENRIRLIKVMTALSHHEIFDGDVNGMRLAQVVGGPQFHGAGTISCPDGETRRFIEFEKIFPNSSNTFTLKGANKKVVRQRLRGNLSLYGVMANLIVDAMELRMAPGGDVDFIFLGDEARWIDTDGFIYYGDNRIESRFVSSIDSITENLELYKDEQGAKVFLDVLLTRLKFSKALTQVDKEQILRYPKFVNQQTFRGQLIEILSAEVHPPSSASSRELVEAIVGFSVPLDDDPRRR